MNWRAAKYGRHEFGAEDERVEPALQQADHVGAAVALQAAGFLIDAAELAFGDVAVIAAQLLLGLELHAVVGELALAALAVLAGAVFAPVHRAFRPPPDVLAHPAVESCTWIPCAWSFASSVVVAVAEDRALLCPGRAGTDRQKPRKRKALPRVAKRPADLEIRRARGF